MEFHHIVSEEELNGHGSMYAMAVLRPHSSVGWHQHVGNTEPYFILKGKGVFVDNDGTRTEVGPGDVCVIEVGQIGTRQSNIRLTKMCFSMSCGTTGITLHLTGITGLRFCICWREVKTVIWERKNASG